MLNGAHPQLEDLAAISNKNRLMGLLAATNRLKPARAASITDRGEAQNGSSIHGDNPLFGTLASGLKAMPTLRHLPGVVNNVKAVRLLRVVSPGCTRLRQPSGYSLKSIMFLIKNATGGNG